VAPTTAIFITSVFNQFTAIRFSVLQNLFTFNSSIPLRKITKIMKRLILLLLWLPLIANAQLIDNFSDGDFTQNPEWSGTNNKFKVNSSFQLQLNDTAQGTAYLSTPVVCTGSCEWRFWIKQSFSPSSNNNGRVYLISSHQNLTEPLQGYFLQFGESGSSDAIELFKQEGETVTSICRGTDGLIASSFALNIKVTRDTAGNWKIFVDKNGNGNYIPDAAGTDGDPLQPGRFGFLAKYTKSNAAKFYWDDVYVGEIVVDTTPPEPLSTQANTDSTLTITFNEAVDQNSANVLTCYQVDKGIGHPVTVVSSGAVVMLTFSNKFQNGINYTLSVSNISDPAGNIMAPYSTNFSWYKAVKFDVVFNELYPDPSPSIGLPKYEYIELFNRTSQAISLDGWKLIIGTSEKDFQNIVIKPNGYLITGKEEAANDFANFGDFYGFSSFSLTNSGQTLTLLNNKGDEISRVSYNKNWYHDPEKEEGGWSIEQINPENVCAGYDNWRASISSYGGTPGEQNSVFADSLLLPEITRFELTGNDVLRIWFNQAMDAATIENKTFYTVDNGIGHPAAVFTDETEPQKAELYFDNEFSTGMFYTLKIDAGVANCMGLHPGNMLEVSFGIPETLEPGDVVINEILFNPLSNGTDYVELYNRSGKVVDLSHCNIGTIKVSPPNPPDTIYFPVAGEQLLFIPGSYLVLTKSPETVIAQYYTSAPDAFWKVDPFPAYNNQSGTVLFSTKDNTIIDAFAYNENMQYPLLNYFDGVALERINPNSPSNDANNWHSAAESVGFGTPGYQNSQWISSETPTGEITVEPELFSPDNDGHNDVININYRFNQPCTNIKINVYNQNGRMIRHLTDHELGGTSGSVSWDGLTDDNTKAPAGIYIFHIQVFDMNGGVRSWKKTGVLATQL
jgi:hypothetical protein